MKWSFSGRDRGLRAEKLIARKVVSHICGSAATPSASEHISAAVQRDLNASTLHPLRTLRAPWT